MSEDVRERARKRLSEAHEFGRTPEGLAAAEDAARLADAAEDAELAFDARDLLLDLAVFGGFKDRLLVAFAWCLAHADKKAEEDPDGYVPTMMLWKYKWIIPALASFPQISRQQIFSALDDFQKRCRAANYNDRAVLLLRIRLGITMGDLAAAREAHAQWEQTTRDFISDCEACELSVISELHGRLGEHQHALEIAGPILTGRMKCAEVPHTTYADLLETYWKLGRRDDAEATHRRGYRMIRSNREFITEHGWHIEHLIRSGNLERAAELVRRHLPWAMETADMDDRFMFFRSTRSFVRALLGQGRKNLRFKLPAPHGTLSPQQLHDWLEPQLADLARQFDTRNGNSKYATLCQQQ